MSVASKICGLSSEAAVAAAVDCGAAYVGFVFYAPSPRAVTAARAAALCRNVPPGVRRVGLFVDADDAAIDAALSAAPLDILQFHGRETPARVVYAKARFGRPVMKAISVAGLDDVSAAAAYEEVADLLLFDAKPPRRADALPGGNGLAFDWRLIAGRDWRLPCVSRPRSSGRCALSAWRLCAVGSRGLSLPRRWFCPELATTALRPLAA